MFFIICSLGLIGFITGGLFFSQENYTLASTAFAIGLFICISNITYYRKRNKQKRKSKGSSSATHSTLLDCDGGDCDEGECDCEFDI